MGKEKDPLVAALEGQLENMRGQLRVFEDWNKKLHDVAREERRRRELAEADADRMSGALEAAAQEAAARDSTAEGASVAGSSDAGAATTPSTAEAERRYQMLELELSLAQDARRRAETEAQRTAAQNEELRARLSAMAVSVGDLEAEAASLKATVASIAAEDGR